MKILQILPRLEMGGVERGTVEIASALVAAGIPSGVVSAGGVLVKELDRLGVKHYTMDAASKNPFTIWRNAAKIAKIAVAEGYTILHARSRAPAWSAYWASKRTGIPLLCSFHGVYGTKPEFLKIPYNRVMTKGVKTIAVSDFVRRHVIDTYGVDPESVVRIHRGADVTKFNPDAVDFDAAMKLKSSLGFADDQRVITLPGRLTRWKGQEVLLEALGMMRHRDVGCLFVGSDQGRTEYTAGLKAMAAKLPPEMKVVFLERSDDMPAIYAMSDIVVNASSAQPEAFGRVIPEAQAMGRLVCGTAHGGACETIEDGVTGFLVPPGDAKALAERLDLMLDLPPEDAGRICKAAVESVRNNFSVAKMCERTIEIYKWISARQ